MEVYDKAFDRSDRSIINRLKTILGVGSLSAIIYMFVICFCYLNLMLLSIIQPKRSIKKEKTFNYKYYIQLLENKYKIKQL